MKNRLVRRAAALLLALALACSLLTLPAAGAEALAITFEPENLDLDFNETADVSVSGAPAGTTVYWYSTDKSVATVSPEVGTVNSPAKVTSQRKEGKATIYVIINGQRYEGCSVSVTETPVKVTGVLLDSPQAPINMETGDTWKLTATPQPANATIKKIEWNSSAPTFVSVDPGPDGLTATLSAKGARDAVIITVTVTATDGSTAEASCVVNVTQRPAISALTVSPRDIPLTPGESAEFKVTVEGGAVTGNASDDISFSYSPDGTDNPVRTPTLTKTEYTAGSYKAIYTYKVETKSSTAVPQKNQVTITAKANGDPTFPDPNPNDPVKNKAENFCVVTVNETPTPQPEGVYISGPSYVDPDATIQLTATPIPSGTNPTIIWTSDNTSVAKVSSSGLVTGGKQQPGAATITAQIGNAKGTYTVENSGILLSYRPSASASQESLTKGKTVPLYQYHDITVLTDLFGNAKGKRVTLESGNSSVAGVEGLRVTANYPGETTITATVDGTGFTASFNVKVSEDVADAVIVTMGSNASYSFSGLLSQLDKSSQSKAGGPLESVSSLKVSTENGVLYYGYTSPESPGRGVGGSERYYYQSTGQGQLALKDVTFVPLPGFNGIAVVDYTGTATNGTTFNGTIRIEATASGDVSYSTEKNQPVTFAAEHFSAVCMGRNGQSVRYINFSQPTNGRGTLYYNYVPNGQYSPKVVTSTAYYVSGNPSIDGITFVPATDFVGTVDIPYRCIDSSGASFTGTVTVTVQSAGGSAATGDVEYSIARNQRQSFRASDFNDACQRIIGGTLDYIRFSDLPSATAGILYLNYTSSSSTRVVPGRSYYRSSSPYISDISFMPATDYSGTVTIPFTAANTSGDTFSGTLVIHVDDGVGTVHYSTPRNQTVTFAAADFNDASRRVNGTSLNYVRFTRLPSSSAGILYYNYTTSSSTRVSAGTNYYRSGSPSLSNITFVPSGGYNGTVTIPFTAYDDNGFSFNGTVTIAVGSAGQTIFYSTISNGSVRFNSADFNSACRYATGNSLSYVRFDLPASYYGTLYYQYNSSTRSGSSVSSSTNYYYSDSSSRLIGDVSFAASSSSGTVTFGYTGFSTGGRSFSGTVEVRISGFTAIGTSIRYTGSSAPVAFRASDFQNICQMTLGSPLSYVQFTSLPTVGQLNQNYGGPAQTGVGVNTVSHYGTQELDQISYLPRAEYQGTIYVPYTLYDTQGHSHSSSVEIQLSNDYNNSSFSDIASGYWASPSIEFLRYSGITNGYSDNTYRPAQSISRGEFTLMICRAFQFPTTGSSGFPDVPANSTYAGAVASARELGIVEGNNGLFQPDRPITRQSAMTMICRAMDAAGRAVPAADTGSLSSYADGGRVSSFARSSVASLIQMGVVRGDNSNRLNPTAAISRAEMAVILHRVLSR